MEDNIILAHSGINTSLSHLLSAKLFMDSNRPLREVLHLLDQSAVALHDARSEITKIREEVYNRLMESLKQNVENEE